MDAVLQNVEILLVEDNPSDLDLTLHALRRQNLTNAISVARDGAEALDVLLGDERGDSRQAGLAPKVVLLDLKLPKVSGLEVLERIREDPRTKHIPVVILTSSREDKDLLRAYALGVNSYIVKPVSFEQFSEAVRQLGLYWLLLNQSPP